MYLKKMRDGVFEYVNVNANYKKKYDKYMACPTHQKSPHADEERHSTYLNMSITGLFRGRDVG